MTHQIKASSGTRLIFRQLQGGLPNNHAPTVREVDSFSHRLSQSDEGLNTMNVRDLHARDFELSTKLRGVPPTNMEDPAAHVRAFGLGSYRCQAPTWAMCGTRRDCCVSLVTRVRAVVEINVTHVLSVAPWGLLRSVLGTDNNPHIETPDTGVEPLLYGLPPPAIPTCRITSTSRRVASARVPTVANQDSGQRWPVDPCKKRWDDDYRYA